MARTRTIRISPKIELPFVLHVPNMSSNLLSISKLTRDLKCGAHFFECSYVFQDLTSRKTIDNAREHEGQYYFEKEAELNKQAQIVSCESLSREQEIILWHRRLGHPSFSYLQTLFTSPFHNVDFFQCEFCQLAKHVCHTRVC